MICTIGTQNKAKIQAVKNACEKAGVIFDFQPFPAESDVAAQPISDEETRRGAINRATHALRETESEIAIGLEGGVKWIEGTLYLCNWGALVTKDGETFTAMGAGLPLPEEIAEGIRAGQELGPLMDLYTNKQNIRHNEGAIGVFTNGLIDRSAMFEHIVLQLIGQWMRQKSVV
ncbi:DUF84 family protein [Chryseomicrobium imtechense]